MESQAYRVYRKFMNNRDSLRGAMGDMYEDLMDSAKSILTRIMEYEGFDSPLQAFDKACEISKNAGSLTGTDIIIYSAACVELYEDQVKAKATTNH